MIIYLAGFGIPLLDIIPNRLFSYYHHKKLINKKFIDKETTEIENKYNDIFNNRGTIEQEFPFLRIF